MLRSSLYIETECNIVGKRLYVPPQITVIVYTADDEHGYLPVISLQIAVTQLHLQVLMKTLLHRECIVLRLQVLALIVDIQTVGRSRVVLIVVAQRYVLGFSVLGFFRRSRLVKHRILLQLFLDSLLKLKSGKFQKLYGLYLKRGEPLLQFLL